MENICIFPKVDRGWQIYFDRQTTKTVSFPTLLNGRYIVLLYYR